MRLRLSLADKISLAIIFVGLLGILLVYSITESYKQFAYTHHAESIQELASLEVDDVTDTLRSNALDLALSIGHESDFNNDYQHRDREKLRQLLDNQFYQYFVTAGVIKLLKLYILDTQFTLVSQSTEGLKTDRDGELICPLLSQKAQARRGSEMLQMISKSCLYKEHPVYAVIVPFGGLNPTGYIQVVTDYAYNLKALEKSLGKPIHITGVDGSTLYQSGNWQQTQGSPDYIAVKLPINDNEGHTIMTITLNSEVSAFNKDIFEHRNRVMMLALIVTFVTILIVLGILRRSTIPPLAKIHNVLEKLHLTPYDETGKSRVLFQQLLEQIIELRQRFKNGFAIMIFDLTEFHRVNEQYGLSAGDQLLTMVELRLGSILRDSDLISWIGTDTPGHRLSPSGTETKYRATIARLGGDEFGLVLPGASTREQALAVAHRITEACSKPFEINNQQITIKCKVGISIYPHHGTDEKELIRNADKAMHTARSKNVTVAVYQTD